MNKRYKPKVDKLFHICWIPAAVMLLAVTVLGAFHPVTLFILIPTDLFTAYFLVTSLVGYVELREDEVFIKFGFIMKRSIPYSKIRGISTERKFYADSMVSIKNAFEHVNIKFNSFDLISVSVKDNADLIRELEARMQKRA